MKIQAVYKLNRFIIDKRIFHIELTEREYVSITVEGRHYIVKDNAIKTESLITIEEMKTLLRIAEWFKLKHMDIIELKEEHLLTI